MIRSVNAALLVDLPRALDDLALEPLRIRGLAEHRGEDGGDRVEEGASGCA